METTLIKLSYNLLNIGIASHQFWEKLRDNRIFAFSGEMSAGKTTFIHTLCDYLKVEDVVSSPTFSLINEYHFTEQGKPSIIYHMDWYRIKNVEEAISAGIEDCIAQAKLNNNIYCFIEWPEKALPLLPKSALWIKIETDDITERTMTVGQVD